MNAEETVTIERFFQLSQAYGREETVNASLQVRIIVARHNIANVIDVDEDLLATLFNGNTLSLLGLCMKQHMFAHTGKSMGKTLGFNRLNQVIDGIDFERIQGKFAISSNEYHGRRVLQMLQSLRELNTGSLGHVDIQEHNVARVFLELFDSLADACSLGNNFSLVEFA